MFAAAGVGGPGDPRRRLPLAPQVASTLHLPGHSVVVVKALVSLLCVGEINLASNVFLEELMSLCCLLNIRFVTEQVTTWFPPESFVCPCVNVDFASISAQAYRL